MLVKRNDSLRAIPVERRSTKSTKDRLAQKDANLEKTFEIWPPNAEKLLNNAEDVLFLESMKTDQKASFGAHGNKTESRTKNKKKKTDE